jgi:hypothetical protein
MSIETFDQAFVKDFSSQVNILTSQGQSYFKPLVMQRPVTGESFDYNNLGAVKAQKKTTVNEDVKVTNAYHERRGAKLDTTYVALHIDGDVSKQMLLDLNSGYTRIVSEAIMRDFDITVAKAAVGNVLTGKDLTTSTAFSGTTVDVTSTGLTFDKLLEIRKAFRAKGVGSFADEQIYVAISEKEEEQVLGETKLTSKDYNFAKYNEKRAQMEEMLGMKFLCLPSNPDNDTGILQVASSVRQCFAFSSKAIQVGLRHQLTLKVDDLPDKVNTTQIKAFYGIGAMRTEDAHVIKINATA